MWGADTTRQPESLRLKKGDVYFFQVKISAASQNSAHLLHLHILKNNEEVGYLFVDHNQDHWIRSVGSVLLPLNPGDTVNVKITNSEFLGYRV